MTQGSSSSHQHTQHSTPHPTAAPLHPCQTPRGSSSWDSKGEDTCSGLGEASRSCKTQHKLKPLEGEGGMPGGRHISWEPWVGREFCSFMLAEKLLLRLL